MKETFREFMVEYSEKDICFLFNKFDVSKKGRVNLSSFTQEINPKLEKNN